jgi:PhnB protein
MHRSVLDSCDIPPQNALMQPFPYLFSNGTCEEAFLFYASVFGTAPDFMRVKRSPMEQELPPEAASCIMRASLAIGSGHIYGSDDLSKPRHGRMQCHG